MLNSVHVACGGVPTYLLHNCGARPTSLHSLSLWILLVPTVSIHFIRLPWNFCVSHSGVRVAVAESCDAHIHMA